MKIIEILTEINIDNNTGWGSTPNNIDIHYFGLSVLMKPETFLSLAAPLPSDKKHAEEKIQKMITHHNNNGTFASPTLHITVPNEWHDENFTGYPKIKSHEGRHRMNAQLKINGNLPLETHIILHSPNREWRARHITQNIINQLNKTIISEENITLNGPFFKVIQ